MHRARHLIHRLRQGGLSWLGGVIRQRFMPVRPGFFRAARTVLANQSGLEIGGPSRFFSRRGSVPVYAWAARIDNVNFAAATTWESNLKDGGDFPFNSVLEPGRQYLREAGDLHGIDANACDFVLSSHCLEHVANPLGALREWHRVTRPGGHLLLVLPDPRRTFDHRRPPTTLAHLREDLSQGTGEDDLTHLPEILALHDLQRDPGAGSRAEFETRSRANVRNRCLHHHLFDSVLIRAILTETGWNVLAVETIAPLHLVAWARKSAS